LPDGSPLSAAAGAAVTALGDAVGIARGVRGCELATGAGDRGVQAKSESPNIGTSERDFMELVFSVGKSV